MNKCLNMIELNEFPLAEVKLDFTSKVGRVKDFRFWEYVVCIYNAQLKKGLKVIDIGSGGSVLPIYLAKKGCNVTACDLPNSGKFKATIQQVEYYKVPVKIDYEDVRNLSYPDNSFDRVFCVSVLEHIPNNEDLKAFQEIKRILKPDGIFVGTIDFKQTAALAKTKENVGQGFYDVDMLFDRIKKSGFRFEGRVDYTTDWKNIKNIPPIGYDYTMASFCLKKER